MSNPEPRVDSDRIVFTTAAGRRGSRPVIMHLTRECPQLTNSVTIIDRERGRVRDSAEWCSVCAGRPSPDARGASSNDHMMAAKHADPDEVFGE